MAKKRQYHRANSGWQPRSGTARPDLGTSLGSGGGRVAEAPRLGSPDLGAAGGREGATMKHQQRTSRRPAAAEAAQQLLRDGQSRAYGQRGKG